MIPLRDEIFIRGNGERVAFSEYGDPNGEPVMFCHGWPSSRLMAQFTRRRRPRTGGANYFAGPARNCRFEFRDRAQIARLGAACF